MKPDGDAESRKSGFDQQLQVIVVRLIHEKSGVEAAEFWIDDGEGTESPTENGRFKAIRRQSPSMVRRVPPLISSRASEWMLASRRVSSLPPSQTKKTITEPECRLAPEAVSNLLLVYEREARPSTTIWTTNATMPPRDPERKMLAAMSAATPAVAVLRFPSVK